MKKIFLIAGVLSSPMLQCADIATLTPEKVKQNIQHWQEERDYQAYRATTPSVYPSRINWPYIKAEQEGARKLCQKAEAEIKAWEKILERMKPKAEKPKAAAPDCGCGYH